MRWSLRQSWMPSLAADAICVRRRHCSSGYGYCKLKTRSRHSGFFTPDDGLRCNAKRCRDRPSRSRYTIDEPDIVRAAPISLGYPKVFAAICAFRHIRNVTARPPKLRRS